MKKHRLAFELTEEAMAALNALKELAGISSAAEVIRNALRLYAWVLSEKKKGNAILSQSKDGKAVEVVL